MKIKNLFITTATTTKQKMILYEKGIGKGNFRNCLY